MPNVSITDVVDGSTLNFGYTQNKDGKTIDKSLGSSTTIGDEGINLDFEKNLYIYKKFTVS
jgi:hypothetical protein